MIENKLKVPATLETAEAQNENQKKNTVDKATDITILAYHRVKNPASENKQRVSQPYNISFLSRKNSCCHDVRNFYQNRVPLWNIKIVATIYQSVKPLY